MDWNDTDAVALRTFLKANPKFLTQLARNRPKIDGTSVESRAMTGSDVKGYDECLEMIETLTQDRSRSGHSDFITEENS